MNDLDANAVCRCLPNERRAQNKRFASGESFRCDAACILVRSGAALER